VNSEAARIQHWQLKKATYELYKKVQPNIGHFAICDFEKRGHLLGLITQNIDGLHGIAGVSDARIVELHGTDRLVTCLQCGKRFEPASVYENLGEQFTAPTCDACGGLLKSANVSFGQQMPAKAMKRAQAWSEQAEVLSSSAPPYKFNPQRLSPSSPNAAARCWRLSIVTKPRWMSSLILFIALPLANSSKNSVHCSWTHEASRSG
jgi:NAD-dependent SIR2 family protein deacetylase